MQVGQTRATCENASKFSNQAAAQVPGKAPMNEEMLNKKPRFQKAKQTLELRTELYGHMSHKVTVELFNFHSCIISKLSCNVLQFDFQRKRVMLHSDGEEGKICHRGWFISCAPSSTCELGKS